MRVCPGCGIETSAERCPTDGLVTLDAALLERKDPLIGRTIASRYSVESHIGAGGMGSVYRARHRETGGLVALKVMRRDGGDDSDAIKRFSLEAQNAAVLTSAHAVRVLDFGADEETLYLVMELLDGEPLDVRLRRGPLHWREAALVTSHILDALAEAHEHERRIVHRDIKAPNIFLCRTRLGRVHAKVIDFGIARALEGSGAGTRGAIGTPNAMAPEQWRGEAIDGRTDLYALGALLFEMLSGRPPFEARAGSTASERMMQLARQHVADPPPPLGERVALGVPATLVALAHRLLEKQPDRRPASAREVLAVLEGLFAAGDSGALTLEDGDASADTLQAPTAPGTVAQGALPAPPLAPPPGPPRLGPRSPSGAPAPTAPPGAPPATTLPPAQSSQPAPAPPPLAQESPGQALGHATAQPLPTSGRTPTAVVLAALFVAGGLAVVALVVAAGVALRYDGDGATPPTHALFGQPAPTQGPGPTPPGAEPGALEQRLESQAAALEAALQGGGLRYLARLSAADHFGADGAPLVQAWQVLLRDRLRHAAGAGDAEDSGVPLPLDGPAQAELAAALDRALRADAAVGGSAALAISAGTPLVEVMLSDDGAMLRVVSP